MDAEEGATVRPAVRYLSDDVLQSELDRRLDVGDSKRDEEDDEEEIRVVTRGDRATHAHHTGSCSTWCLFVLCCLLLNIMARIPICPLWFSHFVLYP